ncbi:hypothetical protein BDF19DRAFT_437067 [Syncephalis fuscata]|nr:hypothetical protein BDF19DRAFT_437067 [Syncephalis fuscata]
MISNTPNLLSSVSTPNANLSMERITALRTAPTIPLIRSLSDTGSIPRSTSNLKSIAPARPLSNSAVVNNISAPILSAAIAPIPIPCNMLTIGTWRLCVYLPAEQGVRFLLDYSANIILQMAVEINTNSNLGSMQVTVSGPPMFAMEMASLTTPSKDNKSLSTSKPKQATTQSTDNATNNKGKAVQRPSSPLALLTPPSIAPAQQQQQQQRPWMPCRDFTEKHQATPGHALQERLPMNKSTDRHNDFIQAKVESLMTLAPQSSALNRNNITGQMSGTNMAAATTATTPAAINTANMNRISSFGAINAKSYRFTTNGTAPAGCLPSRSLPPVSHFQHQFRVDDPIEPVGLHTFSSPKRPATFTVNDKNARARLHSMAMRRNWMPTQYDMSLVGGSPNEPNSPALSIASANETLETVNDDDGTNRVQNHKMAASMAGRSRSLSAAIPPSPRRISQSINTMNNNKRGKRLQSQMKSQLSGSSSFTEQPIVASPGGITAEQQQNLWLATAMMQQQQQQQQQQPSLSSFAPNIPLATIWAAQMNHNLASSAPNSSQLWQESKPLSDTNTTLPLNSLPTGQLSLQSTPQVNSNMNAPTMPNAGLSNMLNLQLNAPQSAPILEQGSSINTFDYAFGIGGGASSMLPSSLASTNGMSAAELDEATMAFIRDPTPPQSAGIAETSTSHGAISSPVDIPLANNTTGLGLELMDSSSITTTGAVYSNSNTAFYKGHFDVPTTTTTTANSGEGNHDMLFSSATMSADSIFDFSSVMAATNALPTSMDNHMIDSNTLNADQSTASMADISSTSATSASMFDQELPSADLQLDANDLFMLSA